MAFKNKFFNKSSENMSEIPDNAIDLMITSPPYNIDISYGNKWEKGKKVSSKGAKYQDNLPEDEYRILLKNVFAESIRCLKPDGSMFINMKNRYIKDSIIPPTFLLELVPEMFLKNIIIWNFDWGGSSSKRLSSRYEFFFFFTKDKSHWTFNLDEISIPSLNYRPDRYKTQLKNPSDVWTFPIVSGNSPERTNHPAQFPEQLINRIVKGFSNPGEIILDPFMGSGTTAVCAKKLNRHFVGYEIYKEYIDISKERISREI